MSSALAAGRRRGVSRSRWVVLAFISPFVLGVVLFFGYPLVSTIVYSFEKYDQINPPTWVGTQNWHYVFDEYPRFWTALRNTAWLVVVMVSLRLVFGLAVGMLIVRVRAGVGIFRTVFYLPYLAPPVASTLVFVFLLNPGSGPVNGLLEAVGVPAPAWFTDPNWSKPALVLLSLWGIGDLMVIFTASLLDVPRELYEAAELDGAGAFGRFRFITLPTIRPILLFTTVTGVIATMQYYTQALVAGQAASGQLSSAGSRVEPGYPNGSTLTLPQLVYNLGFQNFDTGSASVIAVVMFVLAMACTVLLLKAGGGFLKTGRVG